MRERLDGHAVLHAWHPTIRCSVINSDLFTTIIVEGKVRSCLVMVIFSLIIVFFLPVLGLGISGEIHHRPLFPLRVMSGFYWTMSCTVTPFKGSIRFMHSGKSSWIPCKLFFKSTKRKRGRKEGTKKKKKEYHV